MFNFKLKQIILFTISIILCILLFFSLSLSNNQIISIRHNPNMQKIVYNENIHGLCQTSVGELDCNTFNNKITGYPTLLIDNTPTNKQEEPLGPNKLKKYFPIFNNENIRDFKMSKRSIYSTAFLFDGKKTAELIKGLLTICFPTTTHFSILDACSNVGGNALWFSKYFSKVTAVEIDKNECERLIHNLHGVYKFTNVDIRCNNVLRVIAQPNVKWNVIFFDPPWGGPCYKCIPKLILGLDQYNICDIIDWCLDNSIADCIVLRHPSNTDISTRYLKGKTISFIRQGGKLFYQLSIWMHPNVCTDGLKTLPDNVIIPKK